MKINHGTIYVPKEIISTFAPYCGVWIFFSVIVHSIKMTKKYK